MAPNIVNWKKKISFRRLFKSGGKIWIWDWDDFNNCKKKTAAIINTKVFRNVSIIPNEVAGFFFRSLACCYGISCLGRKMEK